MTGVPARYFDGETARPRDAVVQIGPQNLLICDPAGGVLAVWPPEEVRLVGKADFNQPLRLGRDKSVARLVVTDPSYLRDLRRLCPNLDKLRPGFREVWRPIALWTTVAVASLAFLFVVAIPYAAREAALAIPPDIEAQLGATTADQITRFIGRRGKPAYCSSPAGDAALAKLTRRFAAQTDLPYPLTVRVANSSMINAFTLPGGQVLLLDGLLDFAASPEEVAGVLAHEIGHAQRHHPMEAFVKNVGSATLIGFLLGDITGGSVIAAAVQFTTTAAYTREAEREADADAVALLNGAGIDGAGLVGFFDRVREMEVDLGDVLALIKTHPASGERADFVRANTTADGAALSATEWQALKAICE